jgi:sterol 14-demethylase
MRIAVDRDLCQGHAVCESEAEGIFVLEKRAATVTVLDESPPEDRRGEVEAAVRYCPTHALTIIEED